MLLTNLKKDTVKTNLEILLPLEFKKTLTFAYTLGTISTFSYCLGALSIKCKYYLVLKSPSCPTFCILWCAWDPRVLHHANSISSHCDLLVN